MSDLHGMSEAATRIREAVGDRNGIEELAGLLAAAAAGEPFMHLDLSGLVVDDQDVVSGSITALTETRVLALTTGREREVSVRARHDISRIDFGGPVDAWSKATTEQPLPEGSFVTLMFAHAHPVQLPAVPAKSVSSAYRELGEVLRGLHDDLAG